MLCESTNRKEREDWNRESEQMFILVIKIIDRLNNYYMHPSYFYSHSYMPFYSFHATTRQESSTTKSLQGCQHPNVSRKISLEHQSRFHTVRSGVSNLISKFVPKQLFPFVYGIGCR